MIEHVCDVWETAAATQPVDVEVPCRSGIVLDGAGEDPRFAYVSVGSPIEQLTDESADILDRSGSHIALVELADRLLTGEVACVLAPRVSVPIARDNLSLPVAFIEKRQDVRQQHVLARFLIRQIGLEEVSSHRGAPSQLYANVAALWSLNLALCIDPAMLLTLGADRQRYVDANYTERATDRLPRALGRLHDLGVRSYPRLVIV